MDEFLLGGEVQETSKKNVLKAIEQADLLQEVSCSSWPAARMLCFTEGICPRGDTCSFACSVFPPVVYWLEYVVVASQLSHLWMHGSLWRWSASQTSSCRLVLDPQITKVYSVRRKKGKDWPKVTAKNAPSVVCFELHNTTPFSLVWRNQELTMILGCFIPNWFMFSHAH